MATKKQKYELKAIYSCALCKRKVFIAALEDKPHIVYAPLDKLEVLITPEDNDSYTIEAARKTRNYPDSTFVKCDGHELHEIHRVHISGFITVPIPQQ